LASNYSALTSKFGALEATRAMSLHRNQFAVPSQHPSEIFHVKDVTKSDDVVSFHADVPPFMMDQSYQSVVRLTPTFEPINFSCSQQTTTTTLSRDNSMKCANPKKVRKNPNGDLPVSTAILNNEKRRNSFAEKLKMCTQVLIFRSDGGSTEMGKARVSQKLSNGSSRIGSNSSLKEISEEASAELSQMMIELNKANRQTAS